MNNTLRIFAYQHPYTLVVEPWAEEFPICLGEQCRVVALNPHLMPTFGVEMSQDRLIVWVNEGGSTYEFWRGEHCEFSTPVAIPGPPHFA
jgi:hypothetical protein